MAEFSTGKWEIDTSRDSLLICAPTPDGYKTLVAYAYTWENARLIAAALEMYELLKEELIPISDYGGILSLSREDKLRKLLARIDGKENDNHDRT